VDFRKKEGETEEDKRGEGGNPPRTAVERGPQEGRNTLNKKASRQRGGQKRKDQNREIGGILR